MAKLLDGFSGELAKAWWLRVLSPSFAFWLVGALALSGAPASPADAAARLKALVAAEPDDLWIAVLVIGLMAVAASAWLMDQLTPFVVRLLEGYWPDVLRVWSWRVGVEQARFDTALGEWRELAQKRDLPPAEVLRRIRLDRRLRRFPRRDRILPTRLGNVLCAAETRPGAKYGLDAVTCWPHLWLLLAKENRDDLAAARASLDDGARLWAWGVLSLVWAWWAPVAVPVVAVIAASVGYAAAVRAACVFSDLLEATIDVRRLSLYDALGWPKPKSPADEPDTGRRITSYLFRGSDDTEPRFTFEPKPKNPPAGVAPAPSRPNVRRPMA